MASRSQSIRSFSLLTAVLLGAALILANVVFARASTRVDLTEERLYSISDGTKNILREMRDPAEIRVCWGGLEAEHEPLRRTFAALLDEMADVSDGKLKVRWVDVEAEEGKKEAEEAKVQKFVFGAKRGNKKIQSSGYSSLVVKS